jgi:hypothetical protein
MSFSYKTLNSNDISLTSYIANKQWEVTNTTLSQNGITIYIGENLPINKINPFDPVNDSETSNEEYRRLIFNSIKNLYYQNYTSGSLTGEFFQSSSFINYEQSTLTSGSMLAANRNIPTITGSTAAGNNGTLFGASVYDVSSSLYDETSYDPDKGSKIVVISVDQNIFGSGLSPKSINISASAYNIQDDGEGNLVDTFTSAYIGNVFYSQGLIVLTNQKYLCVFGAPPTTVNDYYSYLNLDYASQTLDILDNDFADCGTIDPSTVEIYGTNFPDYTLNNGIITITPNQTAVIAGNYQLNYTVGNYEGIRSNTSSINLEITSLPLIIDNISTTIVCYGVTGSLPVSFDVNYGVPYYNYSLDGGASYTGSSTIFGATFTGSMPAGDNNIIYVKDHTNTVYSASFSSWYLPITYNTSILKNPCSNTSTDGRIYVEGTGDGTALSASIDGGSYFGLPKTFTSLATGSHTISIRDKNLCTTSSVVTLGVYTPVTASVTQSNVTCYGGSNGSLSIAFTNVTDTLVVTMLDATGSYIYNNVNLSSFSNNVVTASGLVTGSYSLNVTASGLLQCQSYNNTFTLTSPTALSLNITASYINSCSNAISFSAAGGTPPYTYFTYETGSGLTYSSDSSSVSIDGLNSGSYSAFVLDSNRCASATSSIQIFGRTYEYTGSYCVTASGQNTGYISSSGIQQVFTTGPFSGSLVTSSYSNGSNLFGPKVNFTASFISGSSEDTGSVNVLSSCFSTPFYRYYQDTASCPISGCFAPTITSITPENCSVMGWESEYSITYDSASANSTYTIIEYGPYENFSEYATHIYTNSSPIILPLNYYDDTGTTVQPNDIMYFRAYNSCSNGATSSYSEIITAACEFIEPPSRFGYASFHIINNTLSPLIIRRTRPTIYGGGYSSPCSYFTTPTSNPTTYRVAYEYSVINQDSGLNDYFPDPTWIEIGLSNRPGSYTNDDENGNIKYKATITSNNANVDGNIYTTAESLISPDLYPNQTFIDDYSTGTNQFIFCDSTENFTYAIDADFCQFPKPELRINVDRTYYGNDLAVTCSIDYLTP